MADSIRRQIIANVDTRLKTILVAGGYKTGLGSNVFAWRETPLQGSELPGLIYRDTSETKEPFCFGKSLRKLNLDIEAFGSTASTIRDCIADIEKAIFTDRTWTKLALNTILNLSEMGVEQKENIFVASAISVTIEYITGENDPYA